MPKRGRQPARRDRAEQRRARHGGGRNIRHRRHPPAIRARQPFDRRSRAFMRWRAVGELIDIDPICAAWPGRCRKRCAKPRPSRKRLNMRSSIWISANWPLIEPPQVGMVDTTDLAHGIWSAGVRTDGLQGRAA